MASEYRIDLLQKADAYLRGDVSFSELFVTANDLLPEFADDDDAATLAARVIAAEVDAGDQAHRYKLIAEAMQPFKLTQSS